MKVIGTISIIFLAVISLCSAVFAIHAAQSFKSDVGEFKRELANLSQSDLRLEKLLFEQSIVFAEDKSATTARTAGAATFFSATLGGYSFEYPLRWGTAKGVVISAKSFPGNIYSLRFLPPDRPAWEPIEEEDASPRIEARLPSSARWLFDQAEERKEDDERAANMMTTTDPMEACRAMLRLSVAHGDCAVDDTTAVNLDFVAMRDGDSSSPSDKIIGTVWFVPLSNPAPDNYRGLIVEYSIVSPGDQATDDQELAWFRANRKNPGLLAGVKMLVSSLKKTGQLAP